MKMLPCPFCGSIPYLTNIRTADHSFKVGCVSTICWKPSTRLFDTEAEAIATWNHRAPIDPFVKDALRTEPSAEQYGAARERLRDLQMMRLLHVGIGLATEACEILGQLKKYIYYGKTLDHAKLVSDLGDSSWYERIGCAAEGVSLDEMIARNVAELRVRFPDAFDESKAVNRDEGAEMAAAEMKAASCQHTYSYAVHPGGKCTKCGVFD